MSEATVHEVDVANTVSGFSLPPDRVYVNSSSTSFSASPQEFVSVAVFRVEIFLLAQAACVFTVCFPCEIQTESALDKNLPPYNSADFTAHSLPRKGEKGEEEIPLAYGKWL